MEEKKLFMFFDPGKNYKNLDFQLELWIYIRMKGEKSSHFHPPLIFLWYMRERRNSKVMTHGS